MPHRLGLTAKTERFFISASRKNNNLEAIRSIFIAHRNRFGKCTLEPDIYDGRMLFA